MIFIIRYVPEVYKAFFPPLQYFVTFIKKYISLSISGHTIHMKRHSNLPDFSQLCAPEQTPIQDIVSLLIHFFFLGSFCGFLWEILIFLVKDGTFRNRGFFYGPWLPVYGIGAVIFYCLFHHSEKNISARSTPFFLLKIKYHPITIFVKTALLGTVLELVIGWFLDTFFDLRYWNYSSYPFNLHGYICLLSAVGFGVAGMLWICVFSEIFRKLWFSLPPDFRRGFNSVMILLFLADCAAALIFPNTGHGITF